MATVIETNWLAFVLALAIGLLVVWWLWGRSGSDARERHRMPDALDEGVAPARRNQALIDAPSAASQNAARAAATGPDIFGGIGELFAAAAASEVTAARDTGELTEAAAVAPAPPVAAQSDNLTQLKGVGPKLSARLAELGVTSFAQIAAWTEADITAIDAQLSTFAGRATRDNWVEQAGYLARGDHAGYEAKFGKL
jgi:predicted flap endonuclease-1-like 5' DNA nuclease